HARDNAICDKTSARFRAALDELSSGRAEVAPHEIELAEKGLDVEPLSRAVTELDEALVKARQSIDTANADYRFRQRGLLAAIGSIGVLALAIALKLRELGRRRKGQ